MSFYILRRVLGDSIWFEGPARISLLSNRALRRAAKQLFYRTTSVGSPSKPEVRMSRCRSYAPFIVSPNILRAQIEAQGPKSEPPWLPGGLILSIRGFLPVQQQTPPSQRDITPSQREIPAFATRDSRFRNERSHLRSEGFPPSQREIPPLR